MKPVDLDRAGTVRQTQRCRVGSRRLRGSSAQHLSPAHHLPVCLPFPGALAAHARTTNVADGESGKAVEMSRVYPCVPVAVRLWSKVDRSGGPDACWPWLGSTRNGYGQIWSNGKLVRTHRVAYELAHGSIPAGLVIDHLCRTPACANPRHLEPVTNRENTLRGLSGRMMTHCRSGHEYTTANTRITGSRRRCRACDRSYRAHQSARKEAFNV